MEEDELKEMGRWDCHLGTQETGRRHCDTRCQPARFKEPSKEKKLDQKEEMGHRGQKLTIEKTGQQQFQVTSTDKEPNKTKTGPSIITASDLQKSLGDLNWVKSSGAEKEKRTLWQTLDQRRYRIERKMIEWSEDQLKQGE